MGILKKKYFILAATILFLGGAVFVAFNFFPAAKVEGKIAGYSRFLKVYGALEYFDKISQKKRTDAKELKRQALDNMISDMLLDELIKEASPTLDGRAREITDKELKDKKISLESATKTLYGLSVADFKELVLLPQAKRDALTEYFSSDPQRLNELWTALLKNADVKIYYPGFYWQDGEVRVK